MDSLIGSEKFVLYLLTVIINYYFPISLLFVSSLMFRVIKVCYWVMYLGKMNGLSLGDYWCYDECSQVPESLDSLPYCLQI